MTFALGVGWSETGLGTVMPPASCRAEPATAVADGLTTMRLVERPAALALLRRSAPALTKMPPAALDQLVPELSAVSSRTPLSFL